MFSGQLRGHLQVGGVTEINVGGVAEVIQCGCLFLDSVVKYSAVFMLLVEIHCRVVKQTLQCISTKMQGTCNAQI